MSVHPNPMSMAAHVERRRLELLDQAHRHRLAQEATAVAGQDGRTGSEVGAAIAGRTRSLFFRLRPALVQPLELSQSSPGEAR